MVRRARNKSPAGRPAKRSPPRWNRSAGTSTSGRKSARPASRRACCPAGCWAGTPTSIRYRRMLADYAQPPEALFAHRDERLTTASNTPRLLVGHHDLREAMTEVVRDAALPGGRGITVPRRCLPRCHRNRPRPTTGVGALPSAVRPAAPPSPQGPPAAAGEDPRPARTAALG